MPLVMTATLHYQEPKVEYRMYNGQLYKSLDEDYDVLRVELDCMDTMAYGQTYVYREIADEIVDIMKSGTVQLWPKNAHAKRQNGARNLEKSGVRLQAEGEADLAYWRDRFKQQLARFIIAGDKVWVKTQEPVWSLSLREPVAIIEHASCFSDNRDEFGKRHYATDENAARIRIFSIHEFDAMSQLLGSLNAHTAGILDSVDVLMPEAFQLDVDRLEVDRLARACVAHASNAFTKVKPGGGESLFEVAPSGLVTGWLELRDFLRSYGPLEGIPEDLESRFTSFVSEADGFEEVYGPVLLSGELRDAVAYSFDRWENRSINVAATARLGG
jgi:hypothetical protein